VTRGRCVERDKGERNEGRRNGGWETWGNVKVKTLYTAEYGRGLGGKDGRGRAGARRDGWREAVDWAGTMIRKGRGWGELGVGGWREVAGARAEQQGLGEKTWTEVRL